MIYQNGVPRYFIDLGKADSSFQGQIKNQLVQGSDLESIIYKIGVFLGLDWTMKQRILGKEKIDSQKSVTVVLEEINSFAEIAHDLLFISTNTIDIDILKDQDKVIESQIIKNKTGLEYCIMDRYENITKLLHFLFSFQPEFKFLYKDDKLEIIDLTPVKEFAINEVTLEKNFENWINESKRNQTMDEYGSLLAILGYIELHKKKQHLILRVQKRMSLSESIY